MRSDETTSETFPKQQDRASAAPPSCEGAEAPGEIRQAVLTANEGAAAAAANLTFETRRRFTIYALLLMAFVAIASALHWSWYPVFVDTYYHMAVIQGLEQAGGLPTWAFWELAPSGRVHIYPPAIHVVGYLLGFLGVTPEAFITFLSWLLYPAMLLTTWWWIHRVFGPRAALATVILLCGPGALFWNQTSFNANAFALTLAPLALLALESERFLICGVLNLLAATAHPMGLFLPPALVLNTLLRRKKIVPGLLAASLPMLLYAPWLGHIWANRAYLPEERTGGEISIMGIGAGSGLNLGVALAAATLIGVPWILARRREALGLIGPALGFAVVFAMGFGGRFLQFNVHWPLACIGGFGVGMLLEQLDRGSPWRRSLVSAGSLAVAFIALSTWAAFELPLPKRFGGMWRRDSDSSADRAGNRREEPPQAPFGPINASWSFSIGPSAAAKLLSTDSQPPAFGGGGRGGGRGGGPGGFGGRGGARGGRGGAFDPGGAFPPAGAPFGPGPGFGPNAGGGARANFPGGRGGGGGGPGGMDLIHQEGTREFFEKTRQVVKPGEVIYLQNPMAASLVTGVTGRWTSSGILRDVRSAEGRARPDECHFFATVAGGAPGGGPGRFGGPPGGGFGPTEPSESFEKVFENAFGTLWKNKTTLARREPAPAAIPLTGLAIIAGVCLAVGALDLRLKPGRARTRVLAATVAFAAASVCIAPLARIAADELLHPPKPAAASDQPFDPPFPPPPPPEEIERSRGPESSPSNIPEELKSRYDRLQRLLSDRSSSGEAEKIWAMDERLAFRRLLDNGNLGEAEALLDAALKKFKE